MSDLEARGGVPHPIQIMLPAGCQIEGVFTWVIRDDGYWELHSHFDAASGPFYTHTLVQSLRDMATTLETLLEIQDLPE